MIDGRTQKITRSLTLPESSLALSVKSFGGRTFICSRERPPMAIETPVRSEGFRLDMCDLQSGEILSGRRLSGLQPSSWRLEDRKKTWSNQIFWGTNTLFVSDASGLHSYDLRRFDTAESRSCRSVLYREDRDISIDGTLTDWPLGPSIPATWVMRANDAVWPAGQSAAELHLTHDGKHVRLALICRNRDPRPLMGSLRSAPLGDGVAVRLVTNRKKDRHTPAVDTVWSIGMDRTGQVLTQGVVPDGIMGAVRFDLDKLMTVYEIQFPLAAITRIDRKDESWLDVSVTVWDEEYAADPVAQWLNVPFTLHKLSRSEESASLDLADALPELKEAGPLLTQLIEAHVSGRSDGERFIVHALRGGQSEEFALRFLNALDTHVRTTTRTDPVPMIVRLAEQAGVPGKVTKAYRARPGWKGDLQSKADLPETAIAPLKKFVPLLGHNPAASLYFSKLVHALGPTPEQEIEMVSGFLKQAPTHPRAGDYFTRIRELVNLAKIEDPVSFLNRTLEECKLPDKTTYQLRRQHIYTDHAWLRFWHTVGPFDSKQLEGDESGGPRPFEQKKITLKEKYRQKNATLGWRRHDGSDNVVDLNTIYGRQHYNSTAYAVTWISQPQAGQAMLELGTYGPCKIWVNRRLVHQTAATPKHSTSRRPYVRIEAFPVKRIPVRLKRGWNMLLVESSMGDRAWSFRCELVEPDGKGLLKDVNLMTPGAPREVAVVVDARPLATAQLGTKGFRGEYYDNLDFTELKRVRRDTVIDFDWHGESPDPLMAWNTYSVRWTGRVRPRYSETYKLSVPADDGIRLWLDGRLILDDWSYHPPKKVSVHVDLTADVPYEIRLEYIENDNRSNVQFAWSSASQEYEIVPSERVSSSWLDPIIGPTGSRGPPTRMIPKEIWLPPVGKFQFRVFMVNLFGDAMPKSKLYDRFRDRIIPGTRFDRYGDPIEQSVLYGWDGFPLFAPAQWSLLSGGHHSQNAYEGGAKYLKNLDRTARGTVDANGVFTSDGSPGMLKIVAARESMPYFLQESTIIVGPYPSITPCDAPMLFGGSGFMGDIDVIRIYSNAVPESSIAGAKQDLALDSGKLVAEWTFEKLEEGLFHETSGSGMPAKMKNGVTRVTDNGHTFARFTRRQGQLEVAHDPSLDFSATTTLEAWIRPTATASRGSIINKTRGEIRGFQLDLQGGLRSRGMHGWLEAEHSYATNTWTHVVGVFDTGGARRLFIDGKKISEYNPRPQIVRTR